MHSRKMSGHLSSGWDAPHGFPCMLPQHFGPVYVAFERRVRSACVVFTVASLCLVACRAPAIVRGPRGPLGEITVAASPACASVRKRATLCNALSLQGRAQREGLPEHPPPPPTTAHTRRTTPSPFL